MGKVWDKIPPFIKNKYTITLVVFGIYIIFFDEHNLITRAESKREIESLQKEIAFYKENIATDKSKIDALNSSLENLETFAREEYLMRNQNEEIFIINE